MVPKNQKFTNTISHISHYLELAFFDICPYAIRHITSYTYRRDPMNQSGLFILLLSFSFYAHGMETDGEEQAQNNQIAASTNPFAEPEEEKSPVDPSPLSSSSGLFSVSTKTENRSILSSFFRWTGKLSGTMAPDLAGLKSKEEKQRTRAILQQCHQTLSTGNAKLAADLQKQYLERIGAANTQALEIIGMLQAYNAEEQQPDILTITQNAQTLLDMHRETTLPPTIIQALETQLKTAQATINQQVSPTVPQEPVNQSNGIPEQ